MQCDGRAVSVQPAGTRQSGWLEPKANVEPDGSTAFARTIFATISSNYAAVGSAGGIFGKR